MPFVSWDTPLKEWQTPYPCISAFDINLPENAYYPTNYELNLIFQKGSYLKTWGRGGNFNVHNQSTRPDYLVNDPHWIAIHRPLKLHTDPAYPRYSHQLLLRGEGLSINGIGQEPTPLNRGVFYILDGHSPHEVCRTELDNKAEWYCAVSVDSHTILNSDDVLPSLIEYAQTAQFLPNEFLKVEDA